MVQLSHPYMTTGKSTWLFVQVTWELYKYTLLASTLCDSDLIDSWVVAGGQGFKSSLGDSNAQPRFRTIALN